MGQAKTPREAGLTNRNLGTTPVMLSSDTNLQEVLTGTEFTEVHEFTGSLSLSNLPGAQYGSPLIIYPFLSGYKFETARAIHIIPNSEYNSVDGYYMAVSGSTMIGNHAAQSHRITGSVHIAMSNYANDAAAEAGNIVIGQMYHTNGTVKIRIV